jgi:hypothetical protein
MIDRRRVMAGLGAGAALTGWGPNAQARARAPLTWLWLEAAGLDAPDRWIKLAAVAEPLGATAMVVDGTGLAEAAFSDLMAHAVAGAQSHGLAVHAHLGAPEAPMARAVWPVADHPPFAQIPFRRFCDPAAEHMQARLRGLLCIAGLAGVQVSVGPSDYPVNEDWIGLHVSAPARLHGKAITALAHNATWTPRAPIWDGVFVGRRGPRPTVVLREQAIGIA